jgi:hypothetical protein
MREVADRRIHGTTGEPPITRSKRDEATALRPIDGRPPFRQCRELARRVHSDCAIEVDTKAYSVPWRLIGERVQVSDRTRLSPVAARSRAAVPRDGLPRTGWHCPPSAAGWP